MLAKQSFERASSEAELGNQARESDFA